MSQDIAKLNKELTFIEDSFKAGIITRVEYEAAKRRVEDKLSLLKQEELELQREEKQELEKQEKKEVAKEYIQPQEIKKEFKQEKPADAKLEVYFSGKHEEKKEEKEKIEQPTPSVQKKENVSFKTYGNKKLKLSVLLVSLAIIVLVVIFFYTAFFNNNSTNQTIIKAPESFTPVCTMDLQCQKQGFIGTCLNASTRDAHCLYEAETPINITIISSKKCVLCDTSRIENTLSQLYPGSHIIELDTSDAAGKTLVSQLGITSLPAVIFDKSVENTKRFNSPTSSTRSTLTRNGNKYIMKPEAAGAVYFFTNKEEKNTIILFLSPSSSTSIKAYTNLLQLSENYKFNIIIGFYSKDAPDRELSRELCIKSGSEAQLVSYLNCIFRDEVTEDRAVNCMDNNGISKSKVETCIESDDSSLMAEENDLANSFYINTLPVFIFNSQYKQGGSLSVDILKESYCKVNAESC